MISARNSGQVVEALAVAGVSDVESLAEFDLTSFQDLLRQAGVTVSIKALAPLLRLVQWVANDFELATGNLEKISNITTEHLRESLLAIAGIGASTADDILLHVFDRPRYPLDRATYRILIRHGWLDITSDYDETVDFLLRSTDADPNLLRRLSIWFEELGRSHCRAAGPRCEQCPLQSLLPEGGPMGAES
jgi:endonuclease-3 related protein